MICIQKQKAFLKALQVQNKYIIKRKYLQSLRAIWYSFIFQSDRLLYSTGALFCNYVQNNK